MNHIVIYWGHYRYILFQVSTILHCYSTIKFSPFYRFWPLIFLTISPYLRGFPVPQGENILWHESTHCRDHFRTKKNIMKFSPFFDGGPQGSSFYFNIVFIYYINLHFCWAEIATLQVNSKSALQLWITITCFEYVLPG